MAKRAAKQQQPQPPRGHSRSVYHIKHTPAKFVGIVLTTSPMLNRRSGPRSTNTSCRPTSAAGYRASAAELMALVLRRANVARISGSWSENDYDVLDGKRVVGRVYLVTDYPGSP
jgi:hypothetical protein